MRFILGKKGGEKVLSIWWFVVLAIVTVGIVAGVTIFYSADLNVKSVEAKILNDKLFDCLTEEGRLIEDFEKEGNDFDLISNCDLSQKIFPDKGSSFLIKLNMVDSEEKVLNELRIGNNAWLKPAEVEDDARISTKDGLGIISIKRNIFSEKYGFVKLNITTVSNNNGGFFNEN